MRNHSTAEALDLQEKKRGTNGRLNASRSSPGIGESLDTALNLSILSRSEFSQSEELSSAIAPGLLDILLAKFLLASLRLPESSRCRSCCSLP
jgi:hypothetical protein